MLDMGRMRADQKVTAPAVDINRLLISPQTIPTRVPEPLDLDDLFGEEDFSSDSSDEERPENSTAVVTMTQEQLFEREKQKMEEEIVSQYVGGASVNQIIRRYPQYTENQVYNLVTESLTSHLNHTPLLVGAGVFGYQEDIRALQEFIEEEAPKGSPVKLKAIQIRGEMRERLLKYMQSVSILPNNTNPIDGLHPARVTIEEEHTESKRVKQEFEASSPIDRLKLIERFENSGQ